MKDDLILALVIIAIGLVFLGAYTGFWHLLGWLGGFR